MPELPEVETVRAGLEKWVVGRRIAAVEVLHPRPVRRHPAGPEDFAAALTGRIVTGARRRGKFLWLPLDSGDALLGHLGMSGQMLLSPPDLPPHRHLRVVFDFADDGPQLRFVDQRMFGGVSISAGGAVLPPEIAHIGLDPLESGFDDEVFVAAVRRRRTGIKRALLDQTLVSGIGNIYADEALWRAGLHGERRTETLTRPVLRRLVGHVKDVLSAAIVDGGTSFDALYVNVNGESGYFEVSLAAYGREGRPCPRCGTPIRRESFANRSSFSCPKCQKRPRIRAV
ncbi:MAG: bifunctional DNA-formamidopyrimidine glycosylase/DNA-(apurinic or apyrimidinic site) lyase [Micromonosporaceae bacterium]